MPLLRHFDHLNTVRFVSFTCFRRFPFLDSSEARDCVVRHLQKMREISGTKILSYVIMPEHVHFVLHPQNDKKLGRVIGSMKIASAIEIRNLLKKQVGESIWQDRGYDRNLLDSKSVEAAIRYCHQNPVKRRLALTPEEWRWSSANWYAGHEDAPLPMDIVE